MSLNSSYHCEPCELQSYSFFLKIPNLKLTFFVKNEVSFNPFYLLSNLCNFDIKKWLAGFRRIINHFIYYSHLTSIV